VTKIEVSGDELVVHVQGWDKLLAFKSELRIPLSHIEGVARADDELREWKGWQAPGASIPGFWAGTFHTNDGRAFWDVSGGDKAIAIYLRGDTFSKLVIDVEDPDTAVAMIIHAVATPR